MHVVDFNFGTLRLIADGNQYPACLETAVSPTSGGIRVDGEEQNVFRSLNSQHEYSG